MVIANRAKAWRFAAVCTAGSIVGGLIGWGLIGALLLFLPWKRTKPRGFIPHLAWRWGLIRFRFYPGPTQTRFFE